MCDFAADAKAAEELMVGRTLSVARVRELNAKDYFYQMLKDNPEMLKIYPGIENELLKGAIDCHIHAYPDFVHRSQDMIQIAIEASKCGMRAIAFKDHWNLSATSAYLAQRHIDDMIARGELTNRVEVYGGAGTCLVKYDQPGDSTFDPAPQVVESVTAHKIDQTITLSAIADSEYGDPPFDVAAFALGVEQALARRDEAAEGSRCLRGHLLPTHDSKLVSAGCRSNGNHSDDQRNRSRPLHHRQRLRPSAAHGRRRRHARFHPRAVGIRHQAGRN